MEDKSQQPQQPQQPQAERQAAVKRRGWDGAKLENVKEAIYTILHDPLFADTVQPYEALILCKFYGLAGVQLRKLSEQAVGGGA